MLRPALDATAVGHREPRRRWSSKTRATAKAGLDRPAASVALIANSMALRATAGAVTSTLAGSPDAGLRIIAGAIVGFRDLRTMKAVVSFGAWRECLTPFAVAPAT
jgi:hypothetical protein